MVFLWYPGWHGTHYVDHSSLNSPRSVCQCLPNTRIKGMCQHSQLTLDFRLWESNSGSLTCKGVLTLPNELFSQAPYLFHWNIILGIVLQKLKRQSTKYKADKTYSTTVAQRPKNIKKNRYKDILPCKFCFFL